MKHKLLSALILVAFPILLEAQNSAAKVEMADVMRSNGKIYVVVAILVAIFIGLAIFLFLLERRLKRFEKEFGR